MPNRWRRWRGYLDELEEAARVCGGQVADVEAGLAGRFEPGSWPRAQREALPRELVRRALDIPFLRELVEAAWSVSPEEVRAPPDPALTPWREGEGVAEVPSASRAPAEEEEARPPGKAAPQRLRAAERALAGRTRSIAVVLERLTNPRNASAVLRTAEVLGLQEVHLVRTEGRERLMRTVTTRCERYLDLVWHRDSREAAARLRDRGYRILAADHGPGAAPVDEVELREKVAVVLGSEQLGVSAALREEADALFYIPTSGFVSYLNVSVAAGLALYEIDRRMRRAGSRAPLEETDRAGLRRSWYASLAGPDRARRSRYLAWVESPPEPAPAVPAVPSREKAAGRSPE